MGILICFLQTSNYFLFIVMIIRFSVTTTLILLLTVFLLAGCDQPAGDSGAKTPASTPVGTPATGSGQVPSNQLQALTAFTPHYIDSIGPALDPVKNQPVKVSGTIPLAVTGFAVDDGSKTVARGVEVVIDGKPNTAMYGITRPDVATFFKNPAFSQSGFRYEIPAGSLPSGQHNLKLRILTSDGKSYYDGQAVSFSVE